MKCDELIDYDYDPDFPFQSRGRFYVAEEVDAAIAELKAAHHKERHEYIKMVAELKQKLEDAKATAYAESVDVGMENRRLKRALWIARAKTAKAMKATDNLNNYLSIHENSKWFGIYATRIDTWYYKWDDVERKCIKKAEEYK